MDVWDFVNNHRRPVVSINLSNSALYSIKVFNGKHLAVGAADGATYFVELSADLSNFSGNEKLPANEEKLVVQAVCKISKEIVIANQIQ